jgi:hypothetical protein
MTIMKKLLAAALLTFVVPSLAFAEDPKPADKSAKKQTAKKDDKKPAADAKKADPAAKK